MLPPSDKHVSVLFLLLTLWCFANLSCYMRKKCFVTFAFEQISETQHHLSSSEPIWVTYLGLSLQGLLVWPALNNYLLTPQVASVRNCTIFIQQQQQNEVMYTRRLWSLESSKWEEISSILLKIQCTDAMLTELWILYMTLHTWQYMYVWSIFFLSLVIY